MKNSLLFLLLASSCATLVQTHKASASSPYFPFSDRYSVSQGASSRFTKPLGAFPSAVSVGEEKQALSTQAVALACKKPRERFFGFDPKQRGAMASFHQEMTSLKKKGNGQSPLLKDWIDQPNELIKLTGFLNSFGETIPLADPEGVGATLPRGQSVNPTALLDRAYEDMARLISGQVVKIDENRKATKDEERVLLQAAQNLGRKKAHELAACRFDGNFVEILVDALRADYNLMTLGALNKTTLRHNSILLGLSLFAALDRDLRWKDYEIDALLKSKGFDEETRRVAENYRQYVSQTFPLLKPNDSLEAIVSGRFERYTSCVPNPRKAEEKAIRALASQTLRGIETIGIEESFIYEKLSPYGQPAFEALRNPRHFIGTIRREAQGYSMSGIKRTYLEEMLTGLESALSNPSRIETIQGFAHGSVAQEGKIPMDWQKHELLTKRTWLSACHDFIAIYHYAKKENCLAEFYADATPSEHAPCLPGKIRAAQEWFEAKTMKGNDTAAVLEKVFAGMAGIELESAVQQLYRKYVWGNLEVYRAEKGGIPAEEAKKHLDFKREYLTLQAIKEGLTDMVKENLPSVIRKYRLNRSVFFPVEAFHSYKYNHIRLQDGLGEGDRGLTSEQEIMGYQEQVNRPLLQEVERVIDQLSRQGTIEVYPPVDMRGEWDAVMMRFLFNVRGGDLPHFSLGDFWRS